ncbi:MAG: integral rane sensor signal transduction histidine kinase [Verrucomicrobiaceae bacterium]|nr:integral rane sensor signal transduction histidine kinase [Verrucomicrobiaceae bacterium]
MIQTTQPEAALHERAIVLYQQSQGDIHRRTDRMFARLMVIQWVAGIAAALWLSPKTWTGSSSQIHVHVWAAIFLGGAISCFPALLAWKRPGHVVTRHTVAVAQTLTSALLIHLTGGRIETHFHIFGSLAFLAFYRDWRVLMTATIVVATDHMLRGLFWPESVFGVLTASSWRWVEHAGWVLFEDVFLLIATRQTLADMWQVATKQAQLEGLNVEIENRVAERTRELTLETAGRETAQQDLRQIQHRHDLILNAIGEGIYSAGTDGRIVSINPAGANLLGWTVAELIGRSAHKTMHHTHADGSEYHKSECQIFQGLMDGQGRRVVDEIFWRKDGTSFPIEYTSTPVRNDQGEVFGVVVVFSDITARRQAEVHLEKANKQLLHTSRHAGMAEVATNVLHNVGNVLNSVNVSADAVALKVREFRVGKLRSVAALLTENAADLPAFLTVDPRGKALPAYLINLADSLAAPQHSILKEVDMLKDNIDHIKGVVAMQQSYARMAGVLEKFPPIDLVEDAIRINNAGLIRHEVSLDRDFVDVPPIVTDRHKVLQILVNLLSNAKCALEHAGPDKRVLVRVRSNGPDGVSISVGDNGVGIPPENLTRMFQHGFTTKTDGHGFGLHSGALAARELGGKLTAHSDGTGKGALFTLELPLENKES